MTKLEIIQLIILGLAILFFGIWFIVKSIKNKWISELMTTINAAIKEAEESKKTGSEKKIFVLEKVKTKCEELGIPYTLLTSLISKLIDTIIKNYNVIAK